MTTPALTSAQLRAAFLTFFSEHGHTPVASGSLVPTGDTTLLFTNAGMVQFKDVFLGRDRRPYQRAASAQRCVRAGGKHNDLENVGYTGRHHTFFEMLGNFSFGDYFKREAIRLAWNFLTGTLNLPVEQLWVTVHVDDDEAARIWLEEMHFPAERLRRIAGDDNFWSMGDTGPCGPCSEIFYDHGPEVAGGPPGSTDADGDRYMEIWNLVFMQYERLSDGTLTPLPRPSVDTGMGLERIAAVVQGVHSNYRNDLFRHLIAAAANITRSQDIDHNSLKVIADHVRAAAFLMTDGVVPGNEGRGYVLRRIIRRACRHGHKLGMDQPFFHRMVGPLVEQMGEAYPELAAAQARVQQALLDEEQRFAQTLAQGLALLESAGERLTDTVPGDLAFQLYDTYGFPLDLTADWARERGLTLDEPGFERAMAHQREQARAASQFQLRDGLRLADGVLERIAQGAHFTGYEGTVEEAEILQLFRGTESVSELHAGESGAVVLAATPFYAESGGQVGDTGLMESGQGRFTVHDTQKQSGVHVHMGRLETGRLAVGDVVQARVKEDRRDAIRRHHSATHLMNAALREVLGPHVAQRGSLVTEDRLRFDFTHPGPVGADERRAVEDRVNACILANQEARTRELPYAEAVAAGALSMAGETYADDVRVLALGDFSMELCGGTHVARTGDIGQLRIVSESGVSSGVRRIEAVVGEAALGHLRAREALLMEAAHAARSAPEQLAGRIVQLHSRQRELEREIEQLRARLAASQSTDLTDQAVDVGAGTRLVAARLEGADAGALRSAVDTLKAQLGSAVIVLGSVINESRVLLVAGVTIDRAEAMPAGELVGHVAAQVGGRGGGRADFAQAGGTRPEALDATLAGVADFVRARLSG